MKMVVLASGGLDSTVISVLAAREKAVIRPLFVNYGQLAASREWAACKRVYRTLGLPAPQSVNVRGYGTLVPSGLTAITRNVRRDAFTPCRNLLFLVLGGAYAFRCGATAVAIGLLREDRSLFPDQGQAFVRAAEAAIHTALGRSLRILTPLQQCGKEDVVALATHLNITGTYSCHLGVVPPCGRCISCREYSCVPVR